MIAIPASMWVELPGELVKLIAQQKSLRCGTMRQVCKAWRTALVPSFAELEPYLQKMPRETLVPLLAAAWQDSPGDLRAALISACAPVWIEHTVEDVGEITERDWTVYPPYMRFNTPYYLALPFTSGEISLCFEEFDVHFTIPTDAWELRGGRLYFDDADVEENLTRCCRECYEPADVTCTLFKNLAGGFKLRVHATTQCNCEERERYGYEAAQPPFEHEAGEFIPRLASPFIPASLVREEESAQVSDDDSQKTDVDEE